MKKYLIYPIIVIFISAAICLIFLKIYQHSKKTAACFSSIDFDQNNVRKIFVSGDKKIIEYTGQANKVMPSYYSLINNNISTYNFPPLDKILKLIKDDDIIYHFGYSEKRYNIAWEENNKIKTLSLSNDVISGEVSIAFRCNKSFGVLTTETLYFYNSENEEWTERKIPPLNYEKSRSDHFSIYNVSDIACVNNKIYIGFKESIVTHALIYGSKDLSWEILTNNEKFLVTNNFLFKDNNLLSEGFAIVKDKNNSRLGGDIKEECFIIKDFNYSSVSEIECSVSKGRLNEAEVLELKNYLKKYSQTSLKEMTKYLSEKGAVSDFYLLISNICEIKNFSLLLKYNNYIGLDYLETREIIRQSILDYNLELLKELKNNGVDFKKEWVSSYALYQSIFNSFMGDEVLKYIISEAGSLDKRNIFGRTAIYEAVFLERINAVKLLVKYGASIKTIDENGQTPLIFSIIQLKNKEVDKINTENTKKIVLFIASLGFDINHKDKNGMSAIDYADKLKDKEVMKALLN
jgi:hypothetical protein